MIENFCPQKYNNYLNYFIFLKYCPRLFGFVAIDFRLISIGADL